MNEIKYKPMSELIDNPTYLFNSNSSNGNFPPTDVLRPYDSTTLDNLTSEPVTYFGTNSPIEYEHNEQQSLDPRDYGLPLAREIHLYSSSE
tara:strand:+ start:1162 stop:1434 length:273 start_codon:yes stop_codon:yes gene_type:complete